MFAKLFHQVVSSSLTQNETIEVRGVFFMLLAIADKGGNVLGTDEAIARIINVPMEVFKRTLNALMKPDRDSNSKERGGRRVVRLESCPGLLVVNYRKWSEIGSDDQRRAYFAEKKARQREREREEAIGVPLEEVKKEEVYPPESRVLLHYLNEKTNRHYREVDVNLAVISARLGEEGVTVEGCRQMIDRQILRWKGTTQEEYLRPSTLFGKQKFDGYYAAIGMPVSQQDKPSDKKSIIEKDLERELREINRIQV